jgi:hypothetical protein
MIIEIGKFEYKNSFCNRMSMVEVDDTTIFPSMHHDKSLTIVAACIFP